ncbi:MAG: hypothetical protein ACFFD4_27525, partial [Candidatus Odinarchaeota archaeon]
MSTVDPEKKLSEALELVNRYEEYQLMRSWGKFTAIISVLLFIRLNMSYLFHFISELLESLFNIESNTSLWGLVIGTFV